MQPWPGAQVGREPGTVGENLACVTEEFGEHQVTPARGEQIGRFSYLGPGQAELVDLVVRNLVEAVLERLGEYRDGDERAIRAEQPGPLRMLLGDRPARREEPMPVRPK